jgi:hypothetical protein
MLEQFLNSIVMVAGGNNYLLNPPPKTGNGGGDTQGCRGQRTSVPLEIIILFVVVTVGVQAMAIYLVILRWPSLATSSQCVDDDYIHKIRKCTPNNLLDWMTQAVRERVERVGDNDMIKANNLKFWGFGIRENGVTLGILHLGWQRSTDQSRRGILYSRPAFDEEAELRRF